MIDRFNRDNLCPVCNDFHFEYPNEYEMCEVCGWFDDPAQFDNPDYVSGCNGKLSLNEYRRKWQAGEIPPPVLYDE